MKTLDSKVYGIGVAVIVIILAILAFLFMQSKPKTSPVPTATTTPDVTATTTASSTPGYSITEVPVPTLKSIMPVLDGSVTFDASVPPEVQTQIRQGVTNTEARLKADPTDGEDWLNLGVLFHTAGDFERAKAVWIFLTKASPDNAVAFDNLGKLYQFDTPDYPKSETYFKQAIAANTDDINAYLDLYQLYLYSYKQNTTAAVDTLNLAATKFPKSSAPYEVLGQYYQGKKDATDARAAFNKAMDRARTAGDTDSMDRIGKELSALPQ